MTALTTLYNWFSDLKKPTGAQFRALIDSFWHKGEKIPMAGIEGLSTLIEGTASASQLKNHFEDSQAHKELLDKKVDKVAGKGLSSNDYTNDEKQKNEENALKRVANITVTGDVNKIITITFADSTVIQAPFKDNDHIPSADVNMNSLNFNINTGVLTGVKNDGNEITVTLDGRYALISHNHDEQYAAKEHTHSEYAPTNHTHNWNDIQGKPDNLATTDNVKAAVEGIQIGGRNYLLNSGGERYNEYVGTVEKYTIYDIAGKTLERNTTYTLSLEYKSENLKGVDLFFVSDDFSQSHAKGGVPNTNGEWRREAFTFTTNEKTPNGYIRIDNNGSTNGDVVSKLWTRNVKLERGNTPTDWTPAPEDILDSTINIGGRNLLRGTADFEIYEFPYYLQPNYVGMGVVVPETFRGNKVVKLTSNWQGFQCRTTFEELPMVISFWAKTTRPNIVLRCVTDAGVEYVNGGSLIPDGGWHKYVVRKNGRITTSNSVKQGFAEFCCTTEGKHIEEVFVSSFKIEYGNIASDWSPAPEDESFFKGEININNLNDEINRETGVYTVINPGTGSYMLLSFKGTGSTSQLEFYKPNWHEHTRLQVRSRIDGIRYSGGFKDIAWLDDIIRRSIVLDGGQLNQIEHSNSVIFVRSGGGFDLSLLEDCTSCSFRKVFDGDAVTFSCVGKSIIYTGDTQFNGKRGSTAVVSVYNNECYIDIRNV